VASTIDHRYQAFPRKIELADPSSKIQDDVRMFFNKMRQARDQPTCSKCWRYSSPTFGVIVKVRYAARRTLDRRVHSKKSENIFVSAAACEATQSFEKDGVNAGPLRTCTLNYDAAQQ
jgi:hypothetical protein